MGLQYGTEEWDKEYEAEVATRMEQPPPYIIGTPEWVSSYEKLVQQDAAYKEAAKDWEGSVVMHILPDPEHGLDIDLYIFMDLWHGDCRFMKIVPQDAGEAGDFVITGAMERWMQVVKKELDVTKGMMQGKLKLKGDLPTIVRAVKAAVRLVELAGEVGGLLPTEMPQEDVDKLRALVKELGPKFLNVEV
jgi:putative sterol carrier protein